MESNANTLFMAYPASSHFRGNVFDGPLTPPEDVGAREAKRHCAGQDRRLSGDLSIGTSGLLSPPLLDTRPRFSVSNPSTGKHGPRRSAADGIWGTGSQVPGFPHPIPPQPSFLEQAEVSSQGAVAGPESVLFSQYLQGIVPRELVTADTAPTSAIKAPCLPDTIPFIHPYAPFVSWNIDPLSFAGSQLSPSFAAPIDAAYYPHPGPLNSSDDRFPSSLQSVISPSPLPLYPVQAFDFGDMRCEAPSVLGATPDAHRYHPAREPHAPDVATGASLDLSLDLYDTWGNCQQQDAGDPRALLPQSGFLLPAEDFTHDALGPANFRQEDDGCSVPLYTGVTLENILTWSQPQPDSHNWADSTPQSRRTWGFQQERVAGDDTSLQEPGQDGSLAPDPRRVGLSVYPDTVETNAWGSGSPASNHTASPTDGSSSLHARSRADPEKPRSSSSGAHREVKSAAADQLRGIGNSSSKLGEALVSLKEPSIIPISAVRSPARGRKRGRLADDVRKGIHATRLMGACIRCHIQRAKCEPNEADQDNPAAPCKTCLNVDKTSKKTIHNIPCLRYKLTSVVIYRAGGLQLTQRFTHTEVKDVASFGPTFEMKMSQGLCREPVTLQVREYVPRHGDVLHREFAGGAATESVVAMPALCLENVEKTAKYFTKYILANSLAGLEEAGREEHEIVRRTLAMIGRHCQELPTGSTTGTSKVYKSQKELMTVVVNLWFAIRHGIGTASVCSQLPTAKGQNAAPGAPSDRSVPRMIVAQFDSIRHERIYKEFCPKVLKTYESHLTSGNRDTWFTLYLVTFLFLTLVGSASRDRLRHARQVAGDEARETRYGPADHPTTRFVEELQNSGVMLLLYWTYFKRADLMKVDWAKRSPLVAPYQVEFMQWTVQELEKARDGIPQTPSDGCWEDNLFWISRMFVSAPSEGNAWSPPEQFDRSKPSVGRE